ncbi:MAG: hypothetical protein K2X66_11080 [Cyanobacteria bacterium]|nr:hypothetical protein [Cyanobacteriota bacterium]
MSSYNLATIGSFINPALTITPNLPKTLPAGSTLNQFSDFGKNLAQLTNNPRFNNLNQVGPDNTVNLVNSTNLVNQTSVGTTTRPGSNLTTLTGSPFSRINQLLLGQGTNSITTASSPGSIYNQVSDVGNNIFTA